jgi:ketosteroid isomerase-like protein
MKTTSVTSSKAFILVLLPLLAGSAQPQALDNIRSQAQLEKTIASLDMALFDAYNRCDLTRFRSFFADDLEFYHSKDGPIAGSETLTRNILENVCGGDVRRELVSGTLEVHRMEGYGALQIGVHRFHHPKSKRPTGQGRFINLWQYKDGTWKITRVISFDHHIAMK